jgi:hypothetical protein
MSIIKDVQKSHEYRSELIKGLELRTDGNLIESTEYIYSIPQDELVQIIIDLWNGGLINLDDLRKIR